MLGLIWDSHRKAKKRYNFFRRKREKRQEQIKNIFKKKSNSNAKHK